MTVGGTSAYAGIDHLPDLVRTAVALANARRFDHSCHPAQGRLLALLAQGHSGGRIGETGTGCGVGLAWMTTATDPQTSLVSVERDAGRAAAAAQLFTGMGNVSVIHGDWTRLREHGPFDLLVLDGGGKGKDPSMDAPLDPADGWLSLGGTVVLDDFIPSGAPGSDDHDTARRHWLEHPLLRSTEIRLTPALATIVGVRYR